MVDIRISLKDVQRGKPTASWCWKATIPDTHWRVDGTPPGSESGACIYRGNSGTWESPLPPLYPEAKEFCHIIPSEVNILFYFSILFCYSFKLTFKIFVFDIFDLVKFI